MSYFIQQKSIIELTTNKIYMHKMLMGQNAQIQRYFSRSCENLSILFNSQESTSSKQSQQNIKTKQHTENFLIFLISRYLSLQSSMFSQELESGLAKLQLGSSVTTQLPTASDAYYSNSPRNLHVLVIGKKFDDQVPRIMLNIINLLSQNPAFKGMCYVTDPQLYQRLYPSHKNSLTLYSATTHESLIQYVVTVGGDGTILYAAKLFQNRPTPKIVPVEKGTLGFLCKFKVNDLDYIIDTIKEDINKGVPVETKMRLECIKYSPKLASSSSTAYHCLNEVAISKTECGTLLKLQIYLMGELFTVTGGDGILISTPTGSTAYALSAGGPIIHNNIDAILIQPISPNSLSFRSICLPANIQIKLRVSPDSKTSAFVSCDGQTGQEMQVGEEVSVRVSSFGVNVLSSPKENDLGLWTSKLKSLLKWNKTFVCEDCVAPQSNIV